MQNIFVVRNKKIKIMKALKLLLFTGLFVLISYSTQAQNEKHPWAIGIGTNFIDVSEAGIGRFGTQVKDYFRIDKDLNNVPLPTRLYVARYLKNGFTADLTGSFNKIDEGASGSVAEGNYYSADLGIRYDINKLWGKSGWFDPYAKFSVGTIWVDKDMGAVLSPALGFNTWFNESVGLNFETSYRSNAAFGNSELGRVKKIGGYHFQHSISLVYRFGDNDSDGDGVLDKDDLCPQIAGKQELFGCPDTDGDGVADKDDACPDLAGSLNGCPDSDDDGVIDSEDKCPNLAGDAKDGGCLDSDKDGLSDNKDKCPNTFGPIKNNGCPWPDTDGDGVTDNLDNCINEKGPKTNNGCPVQLTEEAKKTLGTYAKTIQFNSGKAEFKPGVTKTLDIIVGVMKEFDGVRFDVEGHSDSSGDDASNLKLSQERAQAVVDYLTSHGIDNWRLHAVGYGETKPIASNKTATGRALNRRVVLSAIESEE
ncbi:cell envelope biogenesis protein OmpA [Wenyingzhuangia marina]|nr:cell envelope biogenesis protein OmpA [Wenyingzhuangia marina]